MALEYFFHYSLQLYTRAQMQSYHQHYHQQWYRYQKTTSSEKKTERKVDMIYYGTKMEHATKVHHSAIIISNKF